MIKLILFTVFLFFSINNIAPAMENDIFEIEAEGSYPIMEGDSIDLAKKVALFTAKRKAIVSAERYLSHHRLIEVYELEKEEIYCLAARKLQAELLEARQENSGEIKILCIRIRARIHASDFLKAETEVAKLEREEAKESYREEMEQHISAEIDPGRDIAKAYRLLREKKWRIMTIYLNHLEKKYANWDRIYMSKAILHYILHEPVFMKQALSKACHLGNQIACDDLKNLKRVHKHDFGLLTFE